jgi:hypothetical protein
MNSEGLFIVVIEVYLDLEDELFHVRTALVFLTRNLSEVDSGSDSFFRLSSKPVLS